MQKKMLWAMLIYFVACFYYAGVLMMLHFVLYPSLNSVQQNIVPVMETFGHRIIIVCYIPAILMVAASLILLKWGSKIFPLKVLAAAALLGIISVTAVFVTSFQQQHLPVNKWLQVLPAVLQVLIVIWLLNDFLKPTKTFARWLFILVFALTFYTTGTDYVEKFINYALWPAIGEKDWFVFRHLLTGPMFGAVYLLPAYLPLFLCIAMFWQRPAGIPKWMVTIFLAAQLWILIVTAIYFVPKIQIPLHTTYSPAIIENLLSNEIPLRSSAVLLVFFVMGGMLLKVGEEILKKK